VEKVVAIAKMSPGIVRFYFDSKAAMLVASLQFLAAEFEERLMTPVAELKHRPVAALELMVDLYLDPEIASPRKVSVWYAFWGEASSRQEYYDICGQKDESFAALVRELIERMIAETAQSHLDADGIALGFIGALEILWQDFAFRTEADIDRAAARRRCMAYLRSIFPGRFDSAAVLPARLPGWAYGDADTHAAERECLFQDAWIVAGHESEIPRGGDFLTIDIGSERALVLRDSSGTVRALRNSCPESPHVLVAQGSGRFDAGIECRRHGVEWSLAGKRRGGVGRPDLQELDVALVDELIFVRPANSRRPGPERQPPAPWFDGPPPQGLMKITAHLEVALAADWKVVVEQWLETPAGVLPHSGVDAPVWEVSPASGPEWSARRYRRLMERIPTQLWRRRFIFPNQLIETRPDGLSVMQAIPAAAGCCHLRRLDYTGLPPGDGARAALYLAERLGAFVRRATRFAAESTQQGMMEFGYEVGNGGADAAAVAWFRDRLAALTPAHVPIRARELNRR